jgi:hypothetical protein
MEKKKYPIHLLLRHLKAFFLDLSLHSSSVADKSSHS